jgi:hypothetical protein
VALFAFEDFLAFLAGPFDVLAKALNSVAAQ